MDTLMTIHGEIRWLVVLVAAVVVVKFVIGWLGKRPYAAIDRTLLMIFTILLDINVLLGLIMLFFGGGFGGPLSFRATGRGERTGRRGRGSGRGTVWRAAARRIVASSMISVVGAVLADRPRPHEEQYFAPARFGVWQFGQWISFMRLPVQFVWVSSTKRNDTLPTVTCQPLRNRFFGVRRPLTRTPFCDPRSSIT